jgi:hypothetical protein
MANIITHKKTATAGKVPTAAQLALGELAVNTYDGKVFTKKSVGGTESVVEVGATASAETATRLATPRTINGVSFDGSANITIADSTKLPLSGGTMTGGIAASANDRLSGFSMLPSGYIEANPTNFRFDQDVLRFITRKSGVSLTLNGFTAGEVDPLFSSYASFVNLANRVDGCSIQVEGFAANNSANSFWFPFVMMHAPAPAGARIVMEIKTNHATVTGWQTLYDGPIGAYQVAQVASASGAIIGARWSFYGHGASNVYVRWIGVIGRNSDGYQWNVMRGGDTMYGDLNFQAPYTVKISGNEVLHAGNYNSYSPTLTGAGASGSWPISVTGSAATATTLQTARTINGVSFNGSANIEVGDLRGSNYIGGGAEKPNAAVFGAGKFRYQMLNSSNLGAGTVGTWNDVLWVSSYTGTDVKGSNALIMSKEQDWIGFARQGYDSATWGTIRTILHDGNYNSYSPTLTGTGASGTWGISITGSSASTTGNAATATKLATPRAINGVNFDGSAAITVPATSGAYFGISNVSNTTGLGLSLYGSYTSGAPSYGLMFSGTPTFGTHGAVTGDWATYFTMTGANTRGWVYKHAGVNVASISGAGVVTAAGFVGPVTGDVSGTAGNALSLGGVNATSHLANRGSVAEASLDTAVLNGFYTVSKAGSSSSLLTWNAGGSVGPVQLDVNYGNGGVIRLRNKTDSANWTAWRTMITDQNYNSYSPTLTGTGASGSWPISVTGSSASTTGNAATATTLQTARTLTIGTTGKSFNGSANVSWTRAEMEVPRGTATVNLTPEATETAVGYVVNTLFGQTDGALYTQVYSDLWKHQIQGDYRTGQIALRGKNNGTWQAWRTVLDSSNYNSYSPTLTGGGASGTWGISITGSSASTTGNAATATKLATARAINGVNFDGSAAITIADGTKLPLAGGTMTGDIIFPTDGRDHSPMGTYDSTKTQQIWSMGAAYRNSATGVNFGTLYGAAYKHTNNATGGAMAGNHQFVWCQNGVGTAALGDGVWTSGNVTAYSDIRVKTNIEVIPDALHKVTQLSGYTFDRIDRPEVGRQTGVIAQEVLKVLPEAVYGDEQGKYSVAYGNLVGLLIESIKELNAKVETLEARLASTTQPN